MFETTTWRILEIHWLSGTFAVHFGEWTSSIVYQSHLVQGGVGVDDTQEAGAALLEDHTPHAVKHWQLVWSIDPLVWVKRDLCLECFQQLLFCVPRGNVEVITCWVVASSPKQPTCTICHDLQAVAAKDRHLHQSLTVVNVNNSDHLFANDTSACSFSSLIWRHHGHIFCSSDSFWGSKGINGITPPSTIFAPARDSAVAHSQLKVNYTDKLWSSDHSELQKTNIYVTRASLQLLSRT